MTAPETILPDLADSPDTMELRFHVRSLLQDLDTTLASLNASLLLSPREPAQMWQLRDTVGDATVAIEHGIQHHLPRLLELIAATSENDEQEAIRPASAPRETKIGDEDLPLFQPTQEAAVRRELETSLGLVLKILSEAQHRFSEVAEMRGNNGRRLRAVALQAAAHLRVASVAAQRCLALAVALHHIADPDAAAAEARDQELATPLREISLEGARSLQTCPHCGAPLGRGDRTFTGSYCENCRTRYFEPAQRTDST